MIIKFDIRFESEERMSLSIIYYAIDASKHRNTIILDLDAQIVYPTLIQKNKIKTQKRLLLHTPKRKENINANQRII